MPTLADPRKLGGPRLKRYIRSRASLSLYEGSANTGMSDFAEFSGDCIVHPLRKSVLGPATHCPLPGTKKPSVSVREHIKSC